MRPHRQALQSQIDHRMVEIEIYAQMLGFDTDASITKVGSSVVGYKQLNDKRHSFVAMTDGPTEDISIRCTIETFYPNLSKERVISALDLLAWS